MKLRLVAALIIAATAPTIAGPKEDLMAVDRAFARMSVEKGYDQAYIANLARGGETFNGKTPIESKADAARRVHDPKAPHSDPNIKITWEPDTGGVSTDGTLGWTEGHHSHTGPGGQHDRSLHDHLGQREWRLESACRYRNDRSQALTFGWRLLRRRLFRHDGNLPLCRCVAG